MIRRLLDKENLKTVAAILAFFGVCGYLTGLLWSTAHAALSGVLGVGIGVVIVFILARFSSEEDQP